MRTISLVNRLKWSFSGNMNPHALVLGDVDNDGDNEFVIGNLSGELAIFKGEGGNGLPTYVCRGLGTITCIAIGDIRNWGRNSIVCINAEGHAHVFDIPRLVPTTADQSLAHLSVDEYLKHGRRASETSSIQTFRRTAISPGQLGLDDSFRNDKQQIYNLQKPNLTLNVPVNVNRVLIADIDGDSLNELILARTDRILHAFQLQTASFLDQPKGIDTPSSPSPSMFSAHHAPASLQSSFSGLSGSREKPRLLSTNRSIGSDSRDKTGVLRKSMGWPKHPRAKDTAAETMGRKASQTLLDDKTFLLDKDVWVFDGQITSLSVSTHPERPDEPVLLVAQPGNTFTIIDCHGNRYNREFTPQYTPRTFFGKQQHNKPAYFGSQPATPDQPKGMPPPPPPQATLSEKSRDTKEELEEEDMATTPKANNTATTPGPLSNFRKATQTIRTFLQRTTVAKDVPTQVETGPENIIVNCEGKIQDVAGDEIQRSSYVVQNWPDVDGDDIMGDDNGAVATEIVIGKRLFQNDSLDESGEPHYDNNHVGMLSMDGKFSIYDLQTKELSEHNLFVTHKLFSLATLDTSKSSTSSSPYSSPTAHSSIRQPSGLQTPSSSPQLRFPPSPAAAAASESYSASQSNVPSPAFSPSSKLSRVPTNASESEKLGIDIPPADDYDHHQQQQQQHLHVNTRGADNLSLSSSSQSSEHSSRRGSLSSGGWSDGDENEQEEDSDAELFVACAWNGVTYLIDWGQRIEKGGEQKVKFQLVKFAFEGRVCAFTAGSYAVVSGHNVPCLFYVDFEDQIFVYYDVHISPGPVTGFTDPLDDDVEEALERIIDFEHNISAINSSLGNPSREPPANDSDNDEVMDLGDGWKGVISGDFLYDTGSRGENDQAHAIDLADFIHECLYGFEDMKEKLENQVLLLEKKRLKNHFPSSMDIRRLSDLNISIEPPLEGDLESGPLVEAGDEEARSSRASSIAGHGWISEPLDFHDDERQPM